MFEKAASDKNVADWLRGLVVDGVHKANSGHPGGALSSMDLAYILFSEFLCFDPDDPQWRGRDRFILSAGHESMLLYSLLFAQGFLNLSELKRFRQLHSSTPGHPENGLTPGVECTTGPLGQGCAMSVGFAIAQEHMAARLDKQLFDHRTWVLLGDGCMQECVTLGAASWAGHLGLSRLVWIYDKNAQQISGAIDRATSDDEEKIFRGFSWNVISIDGHDTGAIRAAYTSALHSTKPTLIIARTIMAKGAASLEGQHKTHGAPFPAEERLKTKQNWSIPADEEFFWPEAARTQFQRRYPELREKVRQWKKHEKELQCHASFADKNALYFASYEEILKKLQMSHEPPLWDLSKPFATREAFGKILESWAEKIPNLIGGSADLEPSNMTEVYAQRMGDFSSRNPQNRNLCFGVREFPMSAASNGIALYGGLIPFDATFLSFSDYSRPALRLGAIQKACVLHIFTHDSFYVGEDGPTHQPVEQLMSLRLIPDLYVFRPADAQETELAMQTAIGLKAPSCLCLSRQKLPHLPYSREKVKQASKGAWILTREDEPCDIVIFATGSEVSLALAVAVKLESTAKKVRVVSVPCWELFFLQDSTYRNKVLSSSCPVRVSMEAGSTLGWERFVGSDGLMIGLDHYGASAPAEDLAVEFGFTADNLVKKIQEFCVSTESK